MWGAIASAAAGLVQGTYGIAENRRNAKNQRDWQHEMSQTAHQREVEDLRKAGLNPILSSGGKGAVAGQGATAAPADLSGISKGVGNAIQAASAKAQIKNVEQSTKRQGIDLALEKGAMDAYNSNDQVRDATNMAMLAHKTGVNPNMAAAVGGASSAHSAYQKAVATPVQKTIDKIQEESMTNHYRKLNKDVGKTGKQLKSERDRKKSYGGPSREALMKPRSTRKKTNNTYYR